MGFTTAFGAAAVSQTGAVYLCGGISDDLGPVLMTSALRLYNISTNQWTNLYNSLNFFFIIYFFRTSYESQDNSTFGFFGHSMVITGDNSRLIVFGGLYTQGWNDGDTSTDCLANETMFVYNLQYGNWSLYKGSNGTQTRMSHSAVWVNGAMWVMGGTTDGITLINTLDIFRFDHNAQTYHQHRNESNIALEIILEIQWYLTIESPV
jgi:hypothetical protein